MGRGGGEERGLEGREGRVRRRHRRQLCERVQCVRERVSEKVSAAPTSRAEGPRGGPGLGFRGRPPATPSLPASGAPSHFLPLHRSSRAFPPPSAVTCPLPHSARTSPSPAPTSDLWNPNPPATPNPLYPRPPPPAFSPGGRRAGWGALSLGGGASGDQDAQTIVDARGRRHLRHPLQERGPSRLLSSLLSGSPSERGSGVGQIQPPPPPDPPPPGARPGPASPPAVLRRGGDE